MSRPIRITVWNEYRQERQEPAVGSVYPDGIHEAVAAPLLAAGHVVAVATLDQVAQGLPPDLLDSTEVLFWWGHRVHQEVEDALAERIHERVTEEGMGFVALHSAHFSKPFLRLMGTSCRLRHAERGELQRIRTVDRSHPIAAGLAEGFEIERSEMYGEPFEIPEPDAVVFESTFAGGETFRSGCCFERGAGRVFYFGPGHESYPVYFQAEVRSVLVRAAEWARPPAGRPLDSKSAPA